MTIHVPTDQLGPFTEQRIGSVFAEKVLATAKEIKTILGLDDRTFSALVESGAIRHVLIGKNTKRYTESDLRAYLLRLTEFKPCPSTSRRKAGSGSSISSTKASGFTARPARLRVVPPNK